MVALAEMFRRHGPEDRAKDKDRLLPRHLAAMAAIEPCRTEALGGPLSCVEEPALPHVSA